jgi:hypothetical protein
MKINKYHFIIVIFLYCFLQSQKTFAVACTSIFTNGIQSTASNGNIQLSYGSAITGGSATLSTVTLTNNTGSTTACSGSNCVASGIPAATSTPTFLTGTQVDGNINVAANGVGNYGVGDYGTVTVGQEASLRLNASSAVYKMRGVTTNYKSELRLRASSYWINGNLTLGQETFLSRSGPAGVTRIFVNGNITMAYNVTTSGFTAGQLLIYATGTITASDQTKLSAFIYGGGNVSFGYQSVINGAVSGSNFIASGNEVTVNYQGSLLSAADFSPFCPTDDVDHYELQLSTTSIACEGATVTVRACSNSSVPCTVATSVNTNITLATNAGTLNATTLTLSSGQATTRLFYPAAIDNAVATVTLSGEQTAATNARQCCTSTSSCATANSCSSTFKRAGFIFSSSSTTAVNIPNQIAGQTDNSIFLRSVLTDNTTGACVARFTNPQTVELAYQCVNPITCIAGQTLSLDGTSVQANNNSVVPASIGYTNKSLTFDVNGSAAIPLNYTDVGQVRLYARLNLTATANDPAYTLSGTSNDFVVKPNSLVVSSVTTTANVANPSTTNTGSGFVAAGEKFKVLVQARNLSGNPTPNFGNEITSEATNMVLSATNLVYPTGGVLTALTNGGTFSATTPAGTFLNADIQWNQVGSITLLPALNDADYLGAGNISTITASGTVGRFYPNHYRLVNSSVAHTCGSYTYMSQPNISVNYLLQAEALGSNSPLINYDNYDQAQFYSATMAAANYVAENADAGNGASLSSRVSVPTAQWNGGQLSIGGVAGVITTAASFNRQTALAAPDGPYTHLQWGIAITDTLDNRSLSNPDMNALTSGTCAGVSCTAAQLGSPLHLRYGRLRLDDAFGPETANLPITFITEYWTGSLFTKSSDDSCSTILRSAISYPSGNLLTPANLVVSLTGGTTTGVYASSTATLINFTSGDANHYFQAPTSQATGSFNVDVDLTAYSWLRFDWNQNANYADDTALPTARFGFGSYRGHDRIIYWREKFN